MLVFLTSLDLLSFLISGFWSTVMSWYLRGSPGGGVEISIAGGDSRSGVRGPGSTCTLMVY